MNKCNFILALILLATIPFGEVYRLFHVPELRERNWFLFSGVKQDIEWYIKDTCEALIWIIVLTAWYIKERKCDWLFSSFVLLLLLYRVVDLIMYWVDFRKSQGVYTFICYVILFFLLLRVHKKKPLN